MFHLEKIVFSSVLRYPALVSTAAIAGMSSVATRKSTSLVNLTTPCASKARPPIKKTRREPFCSERIMRSAKACITDSKVDPNLLQPFSLKGIRPQGGAALRLDNQCMLKLGTRPVCRLAQKTQEAKKRSKTSCGPEKTSYNRPSFLGPANFTVCVRIGFIGTRRRKSCCE